MNASPLASQTLSAELAKLGLAPVTPSSGEDVRTDSVELPRTVPVTRIVATSAEPLEAEASAPKTQRPAAEPRAKLRVIRGRRLNAVFPIYEGDNLVGRRDDRPVDIDLSDLEPPERIWSSRCHAMITVNPDGITIDDLDSLNGTFVNRNRVVPGEPRPLALDDVVQIGTIQFKVTD